jgi:hypothetical protein
MRRRSDDRELKREMIKCASEAVNCYAQDEDFQWR